MKKLIVSVVLASGLIGLASTVDAKHTDWVKTFWDQQDRQTGGGG